MPYMPDPRLAPPPSLFAVVLALTCALGSVAHAQTRSSSASKSTGSTPEASGGDSQPDYSPYYNGAFVEYSVRGGASLATEAPYDGWNVDVGARHSFPMLLGDFRLAYRFDNFGDASASGKLEQHNVGGYLAIHPLYLVLLGSDWLSYSIASLYAEVGGGAQMAILKPDGDGDYRTHFGPFVSLGVGLDIPLSDPDVGYAPWLNLVYRWHVADFDGAVETYDIDMHLLQVGVGWRINGLLF